MIPTWRGYDQHEKAHPSRPWWREIDTEAGQVEFVGHPVGFLRWQRLDGLIVRWTYNRAAIERWDESKDVYEPFEWFDAPSPVPEEPEGEAEREAWDIETGGYYKRLKMEVIRALDHIDRQHPLPAPEPKAGQVWVFLDGMERMVGSVWRISHIRCRVWWSDTPSIAPGQPVEYHYATDSTFPWPPTGAVIVSGQGSPWKDTSGSDEPEVAK